MINPDGDMGDSVVATEGPGHCLLPLYSPHSQVTRERNTKLQLTCKANTFSRSSCILNIFDMASFFINDDYHKSQFKSICQ